MRSRDDAGPSLRAIEAQLEPGDEVIAVDDGGTVSYPPWVRRLAVPGRIVPELWAAGIAMASNELVALTSAGLVVDGGWLAEARRLTERPEVAVGGAIEPGRRLRMVDWALYFCRYSPYMLPLVDADTLDVAADNAVYRADVLADYRHLWYPEFSEPFLHRAMRADGHRLVVRPELRATLEPGAGAGDFSRQRYRHGLSYGQRRSSGSRPKALVASLSAPVVPALMAARAGRRVWAKGRHRCRFVVAVPLVCWFYACWAAGEAVGRMAVATGGPRISPPHSPDGQAPAEKSL
ncbi:MAG: glycosyltransferase [Acidimicrobiales bacterium]